MSRTCSTLTCLVYILAGWAPQGTDTKTLKSACHGGPREQCALSGGSASLLRVVLSWEPGPLNPSPAWSLDAGCPQEGALTVQKQVSFLSAISG
jgi:hypothetical protein